MDALPIPTTGFRLFKFAIQILFLSHTFPTLLP